MRADLPRGPSEFDFPCQTCGHPPMCHRLDDSLNLDPTDPETPFRCLGIRAITPKGARCEFDCPTYSAPPGYAEWIDLRAATIGPDERTTR